MPIFIQNIIEHSGIKHTDTQIKHIKNQNYNKLINKISKQMKTKTTENKPS
jgi:hypothetical protein